MNMLDYLPTIFMLLLTIGALLGVRLAWQRIQLMQGQIDELKQQLQFQQQSITGLTAGAVGVDRRMNRMQATEKLLHDRQETFDNQQSAEQPYSHAIRLVQQGATAQRLVEELSLSTSEAELIVRLHGLRESA